MKISKEDQSLLSIGLGFTIFWLITKNVYFLIPTGLAILSYPFLFLKSKVHKLWISIGHIIGWVSQRVILFLLFFLFLTPLAFLKKIFGEDSLQIKKGNIKSTFIIRNHIYSSGDLENIW
jgi:hypothetical protein